MTSLLGPYNSGVAVGAEGAATANINTPTIVSGHLNSVYIKYTVAPTATTDICINGTFDADSDWTKGANWTIPGTKKATAAAATENLTAVDATTLTALSRYYIVYTLVVTSGTIRISDGVTVGTTRSASGTYAELFTAGATAFLFEPVTAFTGTVDNVAIYEYEPHAVTDVVISTTGASLPSYTLLTVAASMTDGIYLPRVIPDDTSGVDLAALTVAEEWPVCDYVNIKIDNSVPGDYVDVWLLVD